MEPIKEKTQALTETAMKLGEAIYKAQQAEAATESEPGTTSETETSEAKGGDDENVVEEISAKGRVMEGSLIAGEDVLDLLEAGREYDVSGMHAASKARMRQLELAERRRKAREAKEAERLEKLGVSVK